MTNKSLSRQNTSVVSPQPWCPSLIVRAQPGLSLAHGLLCRDATQRQTVTTEYLCRVPPALVPQPYRTCPAWSVARTWPSLSLRNTVPDCHGRASLPCAHSLVSTQCLAPLSRHRTLCCNMENLMSWNSMLRRKVYLVSTQFQATVSTSNSLLRRKLSWPLPQTRSRQESTLS